MSLALNNVQFGTTYFNSATNTFRIKLDNKQHECVVDQSRPFLSHAASGLALFSNTDYYGVLVNYNQNPTLPVPHNALLHFAEKCLTAAVQKVGFKQYPIKINGIKQVEQFTKTAANEFEFSLPLSS